MNKAFRRVIEWHLSEIGAEYRDVEEVLSLVDQGLAAGDAETAAVMVSLLDEAGRRANESEDALILELIEVGKRLALAEHTLAQADTMIAIRSIMDLPPGNPIVSRIRAFKIAEHMKALKESL